jgi:hypothetical protein
MPNIEFEKSIILILVEVIDYIPNSVVSKTIVAKRNEKNSPGTISQR